MPKNFKTTLPKCENAPGTTDFTVYRGQIDIVTGGFPCQPFSKAGRRKGKQDDRFLWPEMLRAIQEIQPPWVVGENVPEIRKLALNMVLTSLEDCGYQAEVFVIPASAVGAWHRRERIWIVAHSSDYGRPGNNGEIEERSNAVQVGAAFSEDRKPTHINSQGMEGLTGYEYSEKEWTDAIGRNGAGYWPFPWPQVAASFCRDNDGVPHRMDRIKALGNAVVPQIAFEIFKAINVLNNLK